MTKPQRGDTWSKNGKDVQVHCVKDGWVYGAQFQAGAAETGFESLWRMPLASFWKAVEGATFTPIAVGKPEKD